MTYPKNPTYQKAVCQNCKLDFLWIPTKQRQTRKFCSSLCYRQFRSKQNNHKWSRIDNFLIENYSDIGRIRCATVLGISEHIVGHRASTLGLRVSKTFRSGKLWNRITNGHPIVLICKRCNKEFTHWSTPSRERATFCSKACKNQVHKKIISGTCEYCGNGFEYYHRPSHPKRKYCSAKCYQTNPYRQNPSNCEIGFGKLLDSSISGLIHQFPLNGRFVVDFAHPSSMTIIQVDGCYWHGHSCEFDIEHLNAMQLRNINRDRSQNQYMKKCGWTVIRVWECQILHAPQKYMDKILKSISRRQ